MDVRPELDSLAGSLLDDASEGVRTVIPVRHEPPYRGYPAGGGVAGFALSRTVRDVDVTGMIVCTSARVILAHVVQEKGFRHTECWAELEHELPSDVPITMKDDLPRFWLDGKAPPHGGTWLAVGSELRWVYEEDLRRVMTAPPPEGGVLAPDEGWYPDPTGRHPDRWWDGEWWSIWVRDRPGGTRSEDPPFIESFAVWDVP